MKVCVLGCSGGIGAGSKTTSFLIDEEILVDAGTGVCDLPLETLRKIRHVFVTHSHLDHIASIPLLIDTIFDVLDTPLTVHGRPETLQALKDHIFNGVVWPDFAQIPDPERPVLRYHAMRPNEPRAINGCTVEMIPVNHVVPAAGYRIECKNRAFAFTGDTTTTDHFWKVLNAHSRLDLLIVEAGFPERERELSQLARHYCPSLLAEDLAKLEHRPHTCISHLKPGAEAEIMRECRAVIHGLELHQLEGGEIIDL